MTQAFDHTQYITDIRMALGESAEVIKMNAPFTDREFLRSIIDPGFSGSLRFVMADLFFAGGVSVIQNVTWKWQARKLGATTWVDLHTGVTEQWTGLTETGVRVGLEAVDLTADADSVPLEVRIILTASVAAEIEVHIGGAYDMPAVRVYGESS